MLEKGKKEKHEEQVQFAAYKQFCDDTTTEMQRAIAVLKKQAHDRKQGSFVQVAALKDLSLIPTEAKKTIDAFLQGTEEAPEGLAVSAPEANAYEFQSSGVVEMLEKLLDKFIDERTTLE